MVKKLQGNGIFEGSRMVLPEHREAYIRRQEANQMSEHRKPVLDDQEMQLIERALADSFHDHCKVEITLFELHEDRRIKGIVTTINRTAREIKLSTAAGEWEWIKMKDIISVY